MLACSDDITDGVRCTKSAILRARIADANGHAPVEHSGALDNQEEPLLCSTMHHLDLSTCGPIDLAPDLLAFHL
jgi:hypothetical protein